MFKSNVIKSHILHVDSNLCESEFWMLGFCFQKYESVNLIFTVLTYLWQRFLYSVHCFHNFINHITWSNHRVKPCQLRKPFGGGGCGVIVCMSCPSWSSSTPSVPSCSQECSEFFPTWSSVIAVKLSIIIYSQLCGQFTWPCSSFQLLSHQSCSSFCHHRLCLC